MSDVDYTQFAYKKKTETAEEKKEVNTSDTALRQNTPRPVTVEHKKKKSKALVFFVILICFALIFFGVDFFYNGYLINTITTSLKGNSYNYYMVVAELSSRELAYAQSLLVQEGGGSGYIWQDDKYYVVYSLYKDKTEATTVASKNTRTFVKTASYNSKNTEVFNLCDAIISDLSTGCLDYEGGSITESELLVIINTKLVEANALKTELAENDSEENINILNLAIECLGNINVTKSSKIELLSDIRYVCSSLAINMENYV